MRRIMMLAIALAAAAGPATVHASAPSVITTVAFHYIPGHLDDPAPAVVARGGTLVFANLDIDLHTITSFDLHPDGTPLFSSGPVQPTIPRTVQGVEALPPGTYVFYCSVHFGMFGRLEVVQPV